MTVSFIAVDYVRAAIPLTKKNTASNSFPPSPSLDVAS